MKIYNQDKTQVLNENELDYEKGRLVKDKNIIAHHEAVAFKKGRSAEEIAEQLTAQGIGIEIGYDGKPYKIVKDSEEYGREVEPIEAEPDIQAKEAYDEYEDIKVYVPYTEEELKEIENTKRHAVLKEELDKIMEDIGQEQLGFVRDDYAVKKARAAEIINELRVLEGKEPREVKA